MIIHWQKEFEERTCEGKAAERATESRHKVRHTIRSQWGDLDNASNHGGIFEVKEKREKSKRKGSAVSQTVSQACSTSETKPRGGSCKTCSKPKH